MNFYEHFYPYVKELLCCEEEADTILKTAEVVNSLNPSKQSEDKMIKFINNQFSNPIYDKGHEYNYPGYNAVYQQMNSLKNLDILIMNNHLQKSEHGSRSTGSSGISP